MKNVFDTQMPEWIDRLFDYCVAIFFVGLMAFIVTIPFGMFGIDSMWGIGKQVFLYSTIPILFYAIGVGMLACVAAIQTMVFRV